MCTVVSYKDSRECSFFGRNMDLDYNFGQSPVVTPRGFSYINPVDNSIHTTKYAMVGMGTIINNHPLYPEIVNEHGLCCAGLNYPLAVWEKENREGSINIPPYDLTLWIGGNFTTIEELLPQLEKINLVAVPISEGLPLPTLHWMISDKTGRSIVVEKDINGMKITENPVGVMTNAPNIQWHLTNLNNYRHLDSCNPINKNGLNENTYAMGVGFGGMGLPGDYSPTSRFVLASYLKSQLKTTEEANSSISAMFNLLLNVAMVRGSVTTKSGADDITLYSCCIDQHNRTYYYRTYLGHQIYAVNLLNEDLNSDSLKIYPYRDEFVFTAEN